MVGALKKCIQKQEPMVHLVLSKKISYWLASSVVMWCNIYNMSPSHTSKPVCLLFRFHGRCWFQRGLPSFTSHCGQPLDQKWEVTRFMELLEMASQMPRYLQIPSSPPRHITTCPSSLTPHAPRFSWHISPQLNRLIKSVCEHEHTTKLLSSALVLLGQEQNHAWRFSLPFVIDHDWEMSIAMLL